MAAERVILTYKDYEALPDDGRQYEIHEGELFVTPAPTPKHQFTSQNLFIPMHAHVSSRSLGKVLYAPIDVILSEATIVQPDLVYLETRRLSLITSRGIEGPPTLVVQILSPSTIQTNRTTHMQLFARFAVPHYWIVDPEARAIEAYVLREGGYDLSMRAAGSQPVSLPPFTDLALIPDSIWP